MKFTWGRPTQRVVWPLALSVACLFATPPASADAASISGPRKVVPGRMVSFQVSGARPGAEIRVQLGPTRNRGGNCCGIPVRTPFQVDPSGVGRLTFRWPSGYHRCSGIRNCRRVRWERRMRADVLACIDDGNAGCVTTVVSVR